MRKERITSDHVTTIAVVGMVAMVVALAIFLGRSLHVGVETPGGTKVQSAVTGE